MNNPQTSRRHITADRFAVLGEPFDRYTSEPCGNCTGIGRVSLADFGAQASVVCGRCVGYGQVFVLNGDQATVTALPAPADAEQADTNDTLADEPSFTVGPTRPVAGFPFTVTTTVSVDPMALGREISTWETADLGAFLLGLAQGFDDQDFGNTQIARATKHADQLAGPRDEGVLGNLAFVISNNTTGVKSKVA